MMRDILTRSRMALFLLLVLFVCTLGAADERQWYKGNLHTHTLWSDGNDFPEMVCDWYRRNGYHFLALSDHNILSEGTKWIDEEAAVKRGAIAGLQRYRDRFGEAWVETRQENGKTQVRLKTLTEFRSQFEAPGEFLMIQAEEITDRFGDLPIHINASNLKNLIRPQGGASVRETIARNLDAVERQSQQTGQPMLAHLNHPNFGFAITAEDLAEVLQERFFEVYNGHPGVNHLGDKTRPGVERLWDIANTIRIAELDAPPLFGLATDDSHNYFGERGASPGRGWVMVHAEKLEAGPLIEAIQRGDFYASSGVTLTEISFEAHAGEFRLQIAPRPGATYRTQFIGTRRGFDRTRTPSAHPEKNEPATANYSADVGQVLASVEGAEPVYKLSGDELYVRAVVTSSEAAANPSFEGQKQQAWTQPVGWEKAE